QPPAVGASIPQPVRAVPMPPPPQAREAEIRYSVVVTNQSVRDVLLAMARETKVNFDIHPGIDGTVNLNAIDQTLKQILNGTARHRFWETLEKNIRDMLRETDKLLPEGSSETFVQNRGQSAVASSQARSTTQRSGRTTTQRSGTTVEAPGETQSQQASEFVE